MIDDKKIAAGLAQFYLEQGVHTHQAVIVARAENGNFRGAWVVTCSDRINIANTCQDLDWWTDDFIEPDLTNVNEKRAQFNLPELEWETLQAPDRDPQPEYENWKEFLEEKPYIFPTEDEAKSRV